MGKSSAFFKFSAIFVLQILTGCLCRGVSKPQIGGSREEYRVEIREKNGDVTSAVWSPDDTGKVVSCPSEIVRGNVYAEWHSNSSQVSYCDESHDGEVPCQESVRLMFPPIAERVVGIYSCIIKRIGYSGSITGRTVRIEKVTEPTDLALQDLNYNGDGVRVELCSANATDITIRVQWFATDGLKTASVRWRKKRPTLRKIPFQIAISNSISVLFVSSAETDQSEYVCMAKSSTTGETKYLKRL